jgi:flagellar protein FliS
VFVLLFKNQLGEKGKSITHAIEILLALDEAIDEERGGELAGNLRALYNYCVRQLMAAIVLIFVSIVI